MVVGSKAFNVSAFGTVSLALLFQCTTALASGFDNTGIGSLDLIFDESKFALESSATYVFRNVDYESSSATQDNKVVITPPSPVPPQENEQKGPVEDGAKKAHATPEVLNYMHQLKITPVDNMRCLGRVFNPGTILEELPADWNGRFVLGTTDLQSRAIDGTCAFSVDAGPGLLSFIGGGKYVEADLFVSKETSFGQVEVDVDGSGWGWRVGAAYEVPQFAIRASAIYESQVDIEAKGDFNGTFQGSLDDPVFYTLPAQSELVMPQAVEVRLQSGIAPKWLAFLGVKWTDWSVLDVLEVDASGTSPRPIVTSSGPALNPDGSIKLADTQESIKSTRYFNFKDGWTITGGIGHQLTPKIQVGSSVTWDSGIGGSYSDTYQLGVGTSYKINENAVFSLGGAAVYKTGAKNRVQRGTSQLDNSGHGSITDGFFPETVSVADEKFDLSYDESFNFGVTAKLKLQF